MSAVNRKFSIGIEKQGMSPLAMKGMAEVVVDISSQESNIIEELPVREFDWVITLCGHANETCPFFPGRKIHRGFDDRRNLQQRLKQRKKNLSITAGCGME